MADQSSERRQRLLAALKLLCIATAIAGGLLIPAVLTAGAASPATRPASSICTLRAADLLALAKRFGQFSEDLPAAGSLGVERTIAFEENRHFAYIRGVGPSGDRRVLLLKPATFIVDDRPAAAGPWRLLCAIAPRIAGRQFTVAEGQSILAGECLLPQGAAVAATQGGEPAAHSIESRPPSAGPAGRFLHILHVGAAGAPTPKAELTRKDGAVTLKVAAGDQALTLVLPGDPNDPGTVAISAPGGQAVLPERPLPGGIMPHGEAGIRMMDGWDAAYRRGGRPGWDIGRPALELVKAVDAGTIRPARAVELGCGMGSDSIYLARKGFAVTAMDVAPTALAIAAGRAGEAGVKVRWLLADVLSPPAVGPFDFIYDRGCYHGVRRVSAAGYVKTVNALSKPGTLLLILAGNANEPRGGGPPRVDETELVGDFAKTWDFVWMKETRFDSRDPNAPGGAWAWSVLLRRRGGSDDRRSP